MLFDTDVFIWAQRGNAAAARAIDSADHRALSQYSYMELVQCARNARELRLARDFLDSLGFQTIPLSEPIGYRATLLAEEFTLGRGLRAADALIAATAIEHRLPLVSSNVKHFRSLPGLELVPLRP